MCCNKFILLLISCTAAKYFISSVSFPCSHSSSMKLFPFIAFLFAEYKRDHQCHQGLSSPPSLVWLQIQLKLKKKKNVLANKKY